MKWYLLVLFLIHTVASAWKIEPSKSQVKFLGKTTVVGTRVEGELSNPGQSFQSDLKVSKGKLTGSVTIDLTGLVTGIERRDRHMHQKYLQTARFPTTKLELNPVELKDGSDFTGYLQLHGKRRLVSGKLSLCCGQQSKELKFLASVSLKEFGVEQPTFMGIKLKDDIQVEATLVGKP